MVERGAVEVALVDRLNRPSRCFMESSSLIIAEGLETTSMLKGVLTASNAISEYT